jgi:hypothetical protein
MVKNSQFLLSFFSWSRMQFGIFKISLHWNPNKNLPKILEAYFYYHILILQSKDFHDIYIHTYNVLWSYSLLLLPFLISTSASYHILNSPPCTFISFPLPSRVHVQKETSFHLKWCFADPSIFSADNIISFFFMTEQNPIVYICHLHSFIH